MRILRFEETKTGLNLAHVRSHFVDGISDVPQMFKDEIVATATHSAIIRQKQIENK